jgi:hypothetical protein
MRKETKMYNRKILLEAAALAVAKRALDAQMASRTVALPAPFDCDRLIHLLWGDEDKNEIPI